MAFLKKYNGTRDPALLRLERLIWILIYGGLLTLVLAYFVRNEGAPATGLAIFGGVTLGFGILFFFRRARLPDGQ